MSVPEVWKIGRDAALLGQPLLAQMVVVLLAPLGLVLLCFLELVLRARTVDVRLAGRMLAGVRPSAHGEKRDHEERDRDCDEDHDREHSRSLFLVAPKHVIDGKIAAGFRTCARLLGRSLWSVTRPLPVPNRSPFAELQPRSARRNVVLAAALFRRSNVTWGTGRGGRNFGTQLPHCSNR